MRRFDKELFIVFRENGLMEEYIVLSALPVTEIMRIAKAWKSLYESGIKSKYVRVLINALLSKAYETAKGKEKALR